MHGFEREGIRTTVEGLLSPAPHPPALGSSITHPYITTDFSESQLELVTPPSRSLHLALDRLSQIHAFTAGRIGDERIWPFSMPPRLPDRDEQIPLADYGTSPLGEEKTLYRRGIGCRYGRRRLTLSGVHCNFSLDSFPMGIRSLDSLNRSLTDSPRDAYFHIVRNLYRRLSCFTYLFGASPAFDRSFGAEGEYSLKAHKASTLYAPYATSLRMSEIGYTSKVQEALPIRYDSLDAYVSDLAFATGTCNPDYLAISSGPSEQLNANYLQIAQELYAPLRLQRERPPGEDLVDALRRAGPGHIEIRLLDIDPDSPGGVDAHAAGFLHLAILDGLIQSSPVISDAELKELRRAQHEVVWRGREKGLSVDVDGRSVSFHDAGEQYCEGLLPLAEELDALDGSDFYQMAVSRQIEKWARLTPSGKHLADLLDNDREFIEAGLDLARQHSRDFESRKPDQGFERELATQALKSINAQHALERREDSHPA